MLGYLLKIEMARPGVSSCFIELNDSIVQIEYHKLVTGEVGGPSNDPFISVHSRKVI